MHAKPIFGCLLLVASSLAAQTSSSSSGTEVVPSGVNPIRTSETHSEADGRTTDKQSLERIGIDGRYVPYLDVEKESVQVNSTTVRTIERTYGRDPDGRKTLTQVVQEEKRSLPGGAEKVVRNTSNSDADGRLQIVRREMEDTKQTSATVQETKTTAYTFASDGQMVPSVQSQERRTRTGDHDVQFRKSTMLPDINGNWQLQEVREGVIKDDGKERTTHERVSRPNNDGQLAVVESTVSKEADTAPGEGRDTVESYSTSVPGSADEGRMRLNQRTTTVRRKSLSGGTLTEQQVTQRNPGAPGDDPRPTQKTIDIMRPMSAGGTEHNQQTISIDTNGSSNVVWVDTGKASSTVQVETQKATPPSAVKIDDQPQAKPQ